MDKWKLNKRTGLLESPKIQELKRRETIHFCICLIFITLFCLSLITNVMLVKENKFLKNELEIYSGQPDYFQFQD